MNFRLAPSVVVARWSVLAMGASYGLSCSVLVAGLRKACHSAMLEFGPTISSCEIRQLLAHKGFTSG